MKNMVIIYVLEMVSLPPNKTQKTKRNINKEEHIYIICSQMLNKKTADMSVKTIQEF
jgi:hypothetical protein